MGKLIQRTGKPLHVDKPVTSEEIGLKGKNKANQLLYVSKCSA